MKSWLIAIGCSWLLGYVSNELVNWWRGNRAEIEKELMGLDDRIERGWDIDIPDPWQKAYHKIISDAVAYVDRYASDGRFWRNLIRRIRKFKPSQAAVMLEYLREVDWKKAGKEVGKWLLENMPSDLKEIVNEEKHNIAAKVVRAKVKAVMPKEKQTLDKEDLDSRIAAAAHAGKVVAPTSPIRKPEVQALIEELRKKVNDSK